MGAPKGFWKELAKLDEALYEKGYDGMRIDGSASRQHAWSWQVGERSTPFMARWQSRRVLGGALLLSSSVCIEQILPEGDARSRRYSYGRVLGGMHQSLGAITLEPGRETHQGASDFTMDDYARLLSVMELGVAGTYDIYSQPDTQQ